jgi:hypothetical protein
LRNVRVVPCRAPDRTPPMGVRGMRITVGIDVACRAAHQASCADATGRYVWSGHRFSTTCGELERLWERLPAEAEQVTVVMEPTRNAWVPLAAWFRRHGARVVLVPTVQSADLRAYYSKYAKNDRLTPRSWPGCRCCIRRDWSSMPVRARRSPCGGRCDSAPAWSNGVPRSTSGWMHYWSCSVRTGTPRSVLTSVKPL